MDTTHNSTRPDINGVAPELLCNAHRGKLWCLTVLLLSVYVFIVRPVSVPTYPTQASLVLLTQSWSSPVLPTFDALRNASVVLMPHGRASQLLRMDFSYGANRFPSVFQLGNWFIRIYTHKYQGTIAIDSAAAQPQ